MVAGFVRGCSTSIPPRRFPGPDVPLEWEIVPHRFGPHEHPRILSALSHAHQMEYHHQHKEQQRQEQKAATARLQTITPRIFTKVRESMKDRFTVASSSHAANVEEATTQFQMDELRTTSNPSKSFAFRRTVLSFIPEPLLCKRFHVSSSRVATAATAVDLRTRDEAYFQDEILSQATTLSATADARSSTKNEALKLLEELSSSEIPPSMTKFPDSLPKRPPLSIYKSIFEPNDVDANGDDSDKDDGDSSPLSAVVAATVKGKPSDVEENGSKNVSRNSISLEELRLKEIAVNDRVSNKSIRDDDDYDAEQKTDNRYQGRERESEHKRHHKKQKKRKYSSSNDESQEIKRRKKERKKEKKKKKHKHDKRRRQHDDDE
jgi:hypothetical protein